MALPDVQNGVRVVWEGLQHGQKIISRICFTWEQWDSQDALKGLANACYDAWADHVLTQQSITFSLVSCVATQMITDGPAQGPYQPTTPEEGSYVQASMNNATACVISLPTGKAGRSYRGRIYVGGVPDGQVVDGLLSGTYRAAVQAGLTNMLLAVKAATTAIPVVVSYYHNKVLRPTPVTTEIGTPASRTTYPGSQRRRRPGIGS